MSRNLVLIDVTIAVILAALVLILSPGIAIVAILVLIVLVVCGISVLIDGRRGRRVPPVRRRPR